MACLRTRVLYVVYEFGVLTCLACLINWRDWRATTNGVLDELDVLKIDEMFS